jgi:oligopeptide transport system substrate-binding protein
VGLNATVSLFQKLLSNHIRMNSIKSFSHHVARCLGVLAMCLFAVPHAHAADPNKVLRYAFPAQESGFDPAGATDVYSSQVIQSIFETLYTYDYLASPVKLIPLTAEAMPEVSADAKTYTIKVKKGIYFSPDPAIKNAKRELTAADYIYSFKRLLDPKGASPHAWLLEGKILGLDDLAAEAKKSGKFDYDRKIEGLTELDRYTLRIRLSAPDFNLGMILAHTPTAAVAREVVEQYGDAQARVMANPVGTGPYLLGEWVRSSKIILTANPDFRGLVWDFAPSADTKDQKIVAAMKGKTLPQIGRIEISIMEEAQSSWLAFQSKQLDLLGVGGSLAPRAIRNGKILPELASKGIQLSRAVDPEHTITFWNMQDPIVGGMSKEKIALRRAMAMSLNIEENVRVLGNGQSIALQHPIPPGVVGHDPSYKSSIQYNPAAANALLDKFGYKKGKDGWRTLPDGSPLVIRNTSMGGSSGKTAAEVLRKDFGAIGIQVEHDFKLFPEFLKQVKACKVMMGGAAWIADYPDGDNFMQLFYGKNIGQTNNGCVAIPEYDRLYEQSQKLPAGPERDLLYHKMVRVMEVYSAQRLGVARYRNILIQPHVIGYKKHPILLAEWIYFDVEPLR